MENQCGHEHQENMELRNFKKLGLDMNPVVFLASGAFILIFCIYALFNLEQAYHLSELFREFIATNLNWVFIISSNFIVIVCLYLALSKLGTVKIGGVDCKKEFDDFAWYSMLISAGMGIGLMFWAVGEPLHHFASTPPIFNHPDTSFSAMATTFYHWGIHPWGIYALMALALAFFAYNRNMPLSLRSVFYFLFKNRIYGLTGDIIDSFAVVSVLFGLAASLGLGAQQINSGLDYLFGIGVNVGTQILLIVLITLVAIISIILGIHKGIKFLAKLNMRLAFIFMITIFLLGPTFYIIRLFTNSLGLHFSTLIEYASFVSISEHSWQSTWTLPFLAWWIAWSPFVGMFIARISRGRTVRELIIGVILVPSLLSFFWLTVFGGAAINLDKVLDGVLFDVVQENLPVALFELVSHIHMPFSFDFLRIIIYIVATALVINYFITSSDSGSLVVDKISSGGKMDAPVIQRVFWACMEALIAITLLLIGGEKALEVLRTAVTSAGLPLAIILTLMTFSLIKGIKVAHSKQLTKRDARKIKKILKEKRDEILENEGEGKQTD